MDNPKEQNVCPSIDSRDDRENLESGNIRASGSLVMLEAAEPLTLPFGDEIAMEDSSSKWTRSLD